MKTLKVLLQEVVSGIKAWVNSNFAQESNTVHKTGNETVNGDKYLTGYIRHTLTYDCIQKTAFDVRTDPEANRGRDIFRFWEGDSSSLGDYLGGMSYYQETDGSSRLQLICFGYPTTGDAYQRRINFHAYRDGSASFYPVYGSDYINLGTSTNQWKSVYAKNYYYNGTAWGLDKANVWRNNNTFSKNCNIYNSDSTASTPFLKLQNSKAEVLSTGNTPSSQSLLFCEKNDYRFGRVMGMTQSNGAGVKIASFAQDANNDTVLNELQIMSFVDGSKCIFPSDNGQVHLGIYNYKWKTINGINPGALSLPVTDTTDASGDIVPPSGESSINLSGRANTYTPSNNGWLTLAINCASGNCIIVRQNTLNRETLNYMQGYAPGQANIYLTLPVLAGVTYYVFLYATSFVMARFALCQGNV